MGTKGYLNEARAGVVIGFQIVGGGHLCDTHPQWMSRHGTTGGDGDWDGGSGAENGRSGEVSRCEPEGEGHQQVRELSFGK